jgi:hypothetical protein
VLGRAVQRQVPTLKWLVQQRAGVLSGPPRVHISKPEKFVSGVVLALGIVAVPAYILVNVKHYRNRD